MSIVWEDNVFNTTETKGISSKVIKYRGSCTLQRQTQYRKQDCGIYVTRSGLCTSRNETHHSMHFRTECEAKMIEHGIQTPTSLSTKLKAYGCNSQVPSGMQTRKGWLILAWSSASFLFPVRTFWYTVYVYAESRLLVESKCLKCVFTVQHRSIQTKYDIACPSFHLALKLTSLQFIC